jgi:hypothetical protein
MSRPRNWSGPLGRPKRHFLDNQSMRISLNTVTTTAAIVVIVAAIPFAVQDTINTGRVYVFSRQFIEELPRRLTGPGRLRFILQPLTAMLLGIRGGLADAKEGRPPYLMGVLFDARHRRELLRSGVAAVRNLVAMGIVLDSISQLLIYHEVHPGAALLVGPALICLPYALSRALTIRLARRFVKANWGQG